MKKSTLLISILLSITFLTVSTVSSYADCRGCCSSHGGVDCIDGVTKCRDGSPLSVKCKSKGCNKCGSVSSPSAIAPKAQHPALLPAPNKSKESVTVSTPPVSPGSFRCNGHVAYGIPGPEDQLLCREGYAVGYDYDRKVRENMG